MCDNWLGIAEKSLGKREERSDLCVFSLDMGEQGWSFIYVCYLCQEKLSCPKCLMNATEREHGKFPGGMCSLG